MVTASVDDKFNDGFFIITFPNPFINSTIIKYNLEEPGIVSLNFYDNLGNKINTSHQEGTPDGSFKEAGEHQEIFNGDNLSPGVYFYTIQIGERIESGKLVLVK